MNYLKEMEFLNLMQQTYATLFSVTNKLQAKGDQYLRGLTSRQLMTMIAVLHLPEDKTTLNNIAAMLGTTKQNVSTLIAGIERKGYVRMIPGRNNKRSVNIRITDLGKQVMMDCNEMGMDFFADVFAGFSMQELETLWRLLKKLYVFNSASQNGFEEQLSGDIEISEEYQQQLLQRFSERRKNRKSEEKI